MFFCRNKNAYACGTGVLDSSYCPISTTTFLSVLEAAAFTIARMAFAMRPCLPITFPISSGSTLSSKMISLSLSVSVTVIHKHFELIFVLLLQCLNFHAAFRNNTDIILHFQYFRLKALRICLYKRIHFRKYTLKSTI